MKPALLVIDIQKDFYQINEVTAESLRSAVNHINWTIGLFRKHDLPVICIQHMEGDELVPGVEGFDIPDELAILPTDPRVHKTYSNSFNQTKLDEILKEKGVDTIITCGFCAEYCVLSTNRGGKDLDYTAVMLRGGLASDTPAHIPFVEAISEIISYGALKKALE
ncbi:MAG: isochorismatase family protein [Anaerolineaceae bacterium]|nr:isochorismatase family protein [Anaerolineaceae bacterium]